jgi:hypothetical protein
MTACGRWGFWCRRSKLLYSCLHDAARNRRTRAWTCPGRGSPLLTPKISGVCGLNPCLRSPEAVGPREVGLGPASERGPLVRPASTRRGLSWDALSDGPPL